MLHNTAQCCLFPWHTVQELPKVVDKKQLNWDGPSVMSQTPGELAITIVQMHSREKVWKFYRLTHGQLSS